MIGLFDFGGNGLLRLFAGNERKEKKKSQNGIFHVHGIFGKYPKKPGQLKNEVNQAIPAAIGSAKEAANVSVPGLMQRTVR